MDSNIIATASTTTITQAPERWWSLQSTGTGSSANAAITGVPVPFAATIKSFYVEASTGPGSGITRNFVIQVNGVNSALSCNMADTASTANNLADTVALSAGDTLAFVTSASATTAGQVLRWSCLITASANQAPVFSTSNGNLSSTDTLYVPFQGDGQNATASTMEHVMPTSGTIKNLYIAANNTLGAARSYTVTLYKNGVATALTATITASTITASDTNPAHAVSVTAGDRLYYEVVPTASPTARVIKIGVEFNPDVNGESLHCFGNQTPSAAATQYSYPAGTVGFNATQTNRLALTNAATFRKLYCRVSAAPGASRSRRFRVSVEETPGNPDVTIAGASDTTGFDGSNTVVAAAGDVVSVQAVPTGSPAAATAQFSFVSYIAPPVTGNPGAFFQVL